MARIAFFTLNAYEMLTGSGDGDAVGGAQLQQILVGRELANRGHDVIFVEYDTGSKREQTVDGIRVVLKEQPTGSEPRRAVTVFRETWRVLRELEPDVCYRRALDFEIVALGALSRLTRTRFVYGIAHDGNLDAVPYDGGIKGTRLYSRLHHWAVSSADAVVAQNDYQYSRAPERWHTGVRKITNCYDPGDPDPIPELREDGRPVVLWVARFAEFKRPGLVLDIAEELPDSQFVVVGQATDQSLYEATRERAASMGNVRFEGFVPVDAIDRYFATADVFLNTSRREGFPNTFLQAWAYHTPVVSVVVDPDGIIAKHEIGRVCDDSVSETVAAIREFLEDPACREAAGDRAYEYFRSNHSVASIADEYESVLLPDRRQ